MSKLAASVRSASFLLLLFSAASFGMAQTPSYVTVSSSFSVDQTTSVPSHTLSPGDYSIRILDSLKDRSVLRIDDHKGKELATFVALRNPDFAAKHTTGPIFWESAPRKNTEALRGFAFANGTTLEFVYPKAEAVVLAQHNNDTVPAIDPQSEGLPVDSKLSNQDRLIVSLWLLWPTRIGPGSGTPAIEAKRFRPDTSSTQTASAAPQQPVVASPASLQNQRNVASIQPEEKGQVWWPPARHTAARLPQTASSLPTVYFLTLLLLSAVVVMRIRRRIV